MQIIATFDASVTGAPAGFEAAVEAAIAYLDSVIATPITVNIQFSWGEIAGQPMEAGSLGESEPFGIFTNYAQIKSALAAVATSADDHASVAMLPAADPTGGGDFFLNTAEAKALGLYPADATGVDGYVGLDSSATYTFDPNNRAVSGEYDAIGILEHEITEVLGRVASVGDGQTDATNVYSPMDLFRYASAGVRDLTAAGDYFSVNGTTLLSQYNDALVNGGDPGDWATSVPNDSFDAFTDSGVEDSVSATDLRLLDVLGFHSTAPTPVAPVTTPTPSVAAEATVTISQNTSVAQGQSVYFNTGTSSVGYTVSGSPTLTDNGTITLISSAGANAVDVGVGGAQHGGLLSIGSSGALYVEASATGAEAIGFEGGAGAPSLDNAGLIQAVSAAGTAIGVGTADPSATFTNASSGIIRAWGGENAIGVDFENGGAFSNAGTIQATGQNATGVEGASSFSNSGTIDATDVNGGWGSVGVDVGPQTTSVTNTGAIQADYVVYYDTSASNGVSANFAVNNSGHMIGSIALANGNDQVTNSGSITGDIYFGDGNSTYNGNGGTISGKIYLGFGTNTVTLGAGPESVYGGFGADTITGGTGNDFFEIGGGNNKITGGSGFNVLSFADSPAPVTVNLATGTATDDGTDTVSNIQEVIGSQNTGTETLIAGSAAAVLIAGSGADTLVGGAGNDTLVAGMGADTLTGGGGANTFIYSVGDAGDTITDFNAGDVLKIYGAASAASVAQVGGAVQITLNDGEQVLLQNTTLSEINHTDVVYSSAAWPGEALPPSLPTYGSNTIYIEKDLTILAAETLDEQGEAWGFLNEGHSLTIDGSVDVSYPVASLSDDVYGWADTSTDALGNPINPTADTVTLAAGATLNVSATEGSAIGFAPLYATTFTNGGQIGITALEWAYGVDAASAPVNFTNEGSLSVNGPAAAYGLKLGAGGQVANDGQISIAETANTGAADGVYATNDPVNFTNGSGATLDVAVYGFASGLELDAGGQVVNLGQISVSGAGVAHDVVMDQAQGHSLTNSGELVASVLEGGTYGLAYGIVVEGLAGDPFTINNSGIINAVTAITEFAGDDDGGQRPDLDIVNTGTIDGEIDLYGDSSSLTNSGAGIINGEVHLSDDSTGGASPAHSIVDFSGGTSAGQVFIDPGTAGNVAIEDVIRLGRSGGAIDISSAPSLLNMTSGDQSNLVLTVIGAVGGVAPTVTYDVASTGATETQNADGSWTVHAGNDGTSILTDVEQLHFSDTTVTLAGPSAVNNDFNADNRSDFLIENSSGAVVVGEVGSNDQAAYTTVSGLGSEWKFVGDGDFLGDGQSSFLIENSAGAIDIGEVHGGAAQYTQIAALGPEWSFVGVGDFLGDGKSDFLIENTAGAVVVGELGSGGQASYTDVGALGPEWSFKGTGDFLGDGKTQFLIENTGGAVFVGELGTGDQAAYTQVSALGPEWKFVGAGDFTGNGSSQFLIENASGAVDLGQVGASDQTTYTQITSLGPEWKFVGVGDYLDEGHDQFLIENSSGAIYVGDYANPNSPDHLTFTQVAGLGSEWVFH